MSHENSVRVGLTGWACRGVDPQHPEVAETIKAAAVLEWVRTRKLSLRRGADLLHMPYRAFLELMALHRVPSIDYEVGWADREQQLFNEDRGAASA